MYSYLIWPCDIAGHITYLILVLMLKKFERDRVISVILQFGLSELQNVLKQFSLSPDACQFHHDNSSIS